MRRPIVRLVVGILGLAAVIYGGASLTGGWLGTPPWWERDEAWTYSHPRGYPPPGAPTSGVDRGPRDGREWISGVFVAMGLALAAIAARPRRSQTSPPGAQPVRSRLFRLAVGVVGLAIFVYASVTEWVTGETWTDSGGYRVEFDTRWEDWTVRVVLAVGLALVVYAAWPRRSKAPPPVNA